MTTKIVSPRAIRRIARGSGIDSTPVDPNPLAPIAVVAELGKQLRPIDVELFPGCSDHREHLVRAHQHIGVDRSGDLLWEAPQQVGVVLHGTRQRRRDRDLARLGEVGEPPWRLPVASPIGDEDPCEEPAAPELVLLVRPEGRIVALLRPLEGLLRQTAPLPSGHARHRRHAEQGHGGEGRAGDDQPQAQTSARRARKSNGQTKRPDRGHRVATARTEPSEATRPSRRVIVRSQRSANVVSCVTTITRAPRALVCSNKASNTSAALTESKAPVGSSANRT